MAELLAYARANPGKLNYGTPGVGSLGHLIGETFKYAAKVDLVHVPYKGAGPALNDALAGQVQVLFDNLPSSLPHIQSGKLRPIAVTSSRRLESLPAVPTIAEAGQQGFDMGSWQAVFAPAGTPDAIIEKVNAAVNEFLKGPRGREIGNTLGLQIVGGSPADMRRFLEEESSRLEPVIKSAQIILE
jgi:tripartite-type tricarboxylate transporter receptor subunit TctC